MNRLSCCPAARLVGAVVCVIGVGLFHARVVLGQSKPTPAPATPPPHPNSPAPSTPPQPAPENPSKPEKKEEPPSTPAPAPAPEPINDPAPPKPDETVPLPSPRVPTPGSEVVIYMPDGNRVTGLLVSESPDALVVRIAGIETTFKSSMIERYEVLRPVLERYREMRAAIGDEPDQIAMLVEWLRSREQLDLALSEATRLLKLDPNHAEGRRLKTLVEAQIELKKKAKGTSPHGAPLPAPGTPVKAPGSNSPAMQEDHSQFPLLTEAQINTLKVFEVDLNDPPRLVIKRDTVTRLIERYAASPHMPSTQEGRDALYRQTPSAILDLMFKIRARDLYPEVQIGDQPKAMRAFRDDVHAGWFINSCATTQCHGGSDAGRLVLFPLRPRTEPSFYTNFLIMERYRLDDGTPLIDYENPARSALVQMGLPRKTSVKPHPEVPRGPGGRDAWRAVFRDSEERNFQKTVEWIKLMYQPRPQYPIEYQPPKPSEKAKAEPSKGAPR